MTHHRQLIRNAFADLLRGNTSAGENVTSQRSDKVAQVEAGQDALSVYSLNENAEIHADSQPRMYKRVLQLAVEVWTAEREADGEFVADQVDALCEQVECIVESNLSLPDCEEVAINPSLSRLLRTEIDVDEEGRALIGAARITWEIVYYTDATPTSDPTRMGQLTGIRARFNLQDSADSTIEAESEIELQSP